MALSVGIVGLPNVGKSTLFNALTRSKQANVQNYPFCTIDPNVGVVEVPDERLTKLAEVSKSKKIIPTIIEFVDIAGLVTGASKGEGLGNKFLSHIREVDAIVQVVRAFSDTNVVNTQGKVDPKADAEIINIELAMADLSTVQKRIEALKSAVKNPTNKEAPRQIEVSEKICQALERGQPARSVQMTDEEKELIRDLNLLTIKPVLYVLNTDENKSSENPKIDENAEQIEISAKLEAELADLPQNEAREYLKSLGMLESGLDKLIKANYKLLNLITFLTSGEPETRAWTIRNGAKARDAAGVIHTDFIKGFIKADVIGWQDFVAYGGWPHLKESGKMRLEGKEYVVQDGDVIYFHVGV
ncbi:MAG: redox-regulated ATPase YchF [Candidatus Portnoybacteria bacterium RBG_19FT_COMBO_36_7]|uniref:Ribosome-binding ATPase YchF n=1 Tax=Candidatus Portnoybacteria bacterium RBG_19FT_COMBO_36_7 TaxID=1801992 RepID=A0A1G2F8A2_9BACT|nr:MAG: redox-regulated ATPase YchF [Candidatus Portnoybacteria bacterium RBG_19FT_COMBO_36_7]